MLENILTRNDVKSFFDEVITNESLKNKIIPNRINTQAINQKEYLLYIGIDAIVKYAIIINDEKLFEKYLEKLMRLFKKVDAHNEIKLGISKLIVKTLCFKLKITDLEDNHNKKIIINYIYNNYVVNGYFYHSFPSCFINEVKEKGLDPINYYHSLEEIKNINRILEKYKIYNTFSKELENKENISITDSIFMASFYAYNSPLYLRDLCTNAFKGSNKKYIRDAYFFKDYKICKNNLETLIRKNEMNQKEKQIIMNFFDKEWKDLKIGDSYPAIAFIKRRDINKNNLSNYDDILSNLLNVDIYTSVSKILSTRFNEEKIFETVDANLISFQKLPDIKNCYKKREINIEYKDVEKVEETTNIDIVDEYGKATFIALFGVLLITLGVTITIIMLGK